MADVSSIQAQNLILSNYINDIQETPISNPFSDIGQNLLFGTPLMLFTPVAMKYGSIPYAAWQKKQAMGCTYSQAWAMSAADREREKKAVEYLKDNKSRINTFRNKHRYSIMDNYSSELPYADKWGDHSKLKGKDLLKYNNAKIKSGFYDKARQLIQEAKTKKMKGDELKEQLKKIRAAMAEGDLQVNEAARNGSIKPTSIFGKAKHWIKSKTGIYKLKSSILKSSKGASALRTGAKFAKGSGIMAIISGVIEIPAIIDAFKADSEEKEKTGQSHSRGTKQIVKSATKVGASVLGYAAGSAATGALLGSVCPGLGNVVGGFLGFAGGLIGGAIAHFAAGKVMDSAMGEKDSLDRNEAELAKANIAKHQAEQAAKSPEEQEKLLAEIEKRYNEDGGIEDQNVIEAYNSLIDTKESGLTSNDTETLYAQATQASSEYDTILGTLNSIKNFTKSSTNFLLG